VFSYLVRRLLLVVLVVWGAVTFTFALLQLSGDPTNLLLPLDATPEVREAYRRHLGLDQPLYVQYARYLSGAIRGDFGVSLRSRDDAMKLVLERLPNSLLLAFSGLLFAIAIGIPAGVIAALKRGTPTELGVMAFALIGQSTPNFWIGLMLILIFGLTLGWLPISGMGTWQHLVLPTITIGTFVAASITRLTRNGVLQELRSDYVRTARAKGLATRTVNYKHALRNAAIPVVTVIGLQLGVILSGAIITETIFAWPGLGRFVYVAVTQRDFPVVQATVAVFAVMLALINLLVDLSYALLDPRVRYG
jgi:peptide/nickel transport system permease protein